MHGRSSGGLAVGFDGSDEGQDAVALGAAISELTGEGLSLVQVFPTEFFPAPGSTDRRTLRKQAEADLRQQRDLRAPHAITHAVADLSVPRALAHFAERTHADTVVIGSSPSAPEDRAAIGRRGRQLLHNMPFALALARRGLHKQPVRLRRIGVGYDGGPESQAAVALAVFVSRTAGATLVVRTVVDNRLPTISVSQRLIMPEIEAVWEDEHTAARAEAERAVSELELAAEVSAVIGDPGHQLRGLSDEVDLIVVGSRRWGPIARLVTGRVGETLAAGSGCSVLFVPRP